MKRIIATHIFALCLATFVNAETHIVANGETLYSISRMYSISVEDLCKQNNMNKGDVLVVGRKLLVNTQYDTHNTASYTVASGDTYYNISKRYDTDVETLLQLNDFDQNRTLRLGEKILVPAKPDPKSTPKSSPLPSIAIANITKNNNIQKKGDSNLVWPVFKPEVTYINTKISGVILSAKAGEIVTAIKSGMVMYCGTYRGYGQVIFVQAKTGHIFSYIGLSSVNVKKGDYVMFKDKLGTAGFDAISKSPQITLMVFYEGKPVDPATAPRG